MHADGSGWRRWHSGGRGFRGIPLAMLPTGVEARINHIRGGRGLVKKLADMGFTSNARVRLLHTHNPGPVVVEVKDTRIALGRGVAMKIMVEEVR